MREDDDAQQGTGEGSLADGLGETETEYSSSSEPFGDGGIDDSYDDSYDDDSSTDTSETDSSSTESPPDESDGSVVIYDETDDAGGDEPDDGGGSVPADDASDEAGDGGYGEGDADGDVVIYESDDQAGDDTDQPSDEAAVDGTSLDDSDLLSEDASPLEGIGYLLDQVRDALLGEGDEDASGAFDVDPAELTSDTDLDLTGDGVVDGADLHEAGSSLDFEVDEGHAAGHDGGVFDA